MATISGRRRTWLEGELREWTTDGLLSADEAEAIRAHYTVSQRVPLVRVVLGLGGAFVAVGLIWLVAANLDRIAPLARLAAVALLWLGLVTLAEVLARRDHPSARLVGLARLLAAAGFGAVVFQATQSLNVPAQSSSPVGWWAAGALLYAYAVTGLAPLVLAVATGTIWFAWRSADDADSGLAFVTALLVGAVLATAVGVLHTAPADRLGQDGSGQDGSGQDGSGQDGSWREEFGTCWRLAAAVLALAGLFMAALPLYEDEDPLRITPLLVIVSVAAVAAATAGLVLGRAVDRLEVGVVLAAALVGGLLMQWRPPVDLDRPTTELTGRAVVAVLAYLGLAGWYALLGVRRELAGLTWLATGALVVFTTVQSFAVFAPIVSGSTLFLAVGLVLIVVGVLADRGRRHLVHLGSRRHPSGDGAK